MQLRCNFETHCDAFEINLRKMHDAQWHGNVCTIRLICQYAKFHELFPFAIILISLSMILYLRVLDSRFCRQSSSDVALTLNAISSTSTDLGDLYK